MNKNNIVLSLFILIFCALPLQAQDSDVTIPAVTDEQAQSLLADDITHTDESEDSITLGDSIKEENLQALAAELNPPKETSFSKDKTPKMVRIDYDNEDL